MTSPQTARWVDPLLRVGGVLFGLSIVTVGLSLVLFFETVASTGGSILLIAGAATELVAAIFYLLIGAFASICALRGRLPALGLSLLPVPMMFLLLNGAGMALLGIAPTAGSADFLYGGLEEVAASVLIILAIRIGPYHENRSMWLQYLLGVLAVVLGGVGLGYFSYAGYFNSDAGGVSILLVASGILITSFARTPDPVLSSVKRTAGLLALLVLGIGCLFAGSRILVTILPGGPFQSYLSTSGGALDLAAGSALTVASVVLVLREVGWFVHQVRAAFRAITTTR